MLSRSSRTFDILGVDGALERVVDYLPRVTGLLHRRRLRLVLHLQVQN